MAADSVYLQMQVGADYRMYRCLRSKAAKGTHMHSRCARFTGKEDTRHR